jgi:hypothetical protein
MAVSGLITSNIVSLIVDSFEFYLLSEAYVPCHRFFDNTLVYFEGQRLGGLMTHLQKTFRGMLCNQ